MAKKLIPAVAYLRKSTRGKGSGGKEKQEKSIGQQRREIENFAKASGYKIIREYADEGISGWKRGDDRPGFAKMIADAKSKKDISALLFDDLDRFSRADVMEVFADLTALSAAGVKTLHSVNQGEYRLGEGDIGRIIKLVVDVHGGNEFSRKLGRRVGLARRNSAKLGKRSGGKAPFGYQNDGAGSIVPDALTAPIVQRMFEDFDSGARSLRSMANDLNASGVKSPTGRMWSGPGVRYLLSNRAYRGDFVYNRTKPGQFYCLNDGCKTLAFRRNL